jgi:GAF domain-containing protein
MAQRHCLVLAGDELAALPGAFVRAFRPDPSLSLVVAPLLARGRAIGVIVADNKFTRAPITNEDTRLIFTYANAAAIAIDNIRWLEELDNMRQAADVLTRATSLTGVLTTIVAEARRVLGADSAAFWFFDETGRKFILESSVAAGIPPGVWDDFRRQEPQPGQTAFTVMERGLLDVGDIGDRKRYPFLGAATRRLLAQVGARSFLGITLTANGERLGVLYVNYNRPRAFSAEARATAQSFANHAALALQKARFMEQLDKTHTTASVVARVMTSASLDDALQAVVTGTQNVLHCGPVTLYVYDAGKAQLRYPPTVVDVSNEAGVRQLPSVPEDSLVLKMLRLGRMTIVDRTADDPLFAKSRFTVEEKIASLAAVPLKVGPSQVGIMFINYWTEHRFAGNELENIELFANNAAIAIRLAQLREEASSQYEALQALHEVGKMLSGTRDLDKILAVVAQQAWRLNPSARYCSVSLIDDNRLTPVAIYPPELLPAIRASLGERDLSDGANLGVTGRAVMTGQTQLIADVSKEANYILFGAHKEGSELAVPIKVNGHPIGAINIEHPLKNSFHYQDRFIIEALAREAGAALTIVDQFKALEQSNIDLERANRELERNKERLAAAMAKEQTDVLARTWGHFVENRVRHIADLLESTRELLDAAQGAAGADPRLRQIAVKLEYMEQDADDIQQTPILGLRPEDIKSVSIQELLDDYMETYGLQKSRSEGIPFDVSCGVASGIRVSVSPEWMRRIIDGIVDNAIEAMRSSPLKRLTIRARQVNEDVHILISDTGKGIDAETQQRLFDQFIPKRKGERGSGVGLALARMHVQGAYGGAIFIEDPGPSSTTITISLPIERS